MKRNTATGLGITALLLWSTSVAFVRSLSENLGTFPTAAYNYLIAGAVSTLWYIFRFKGTAYFKGFSRRYLFGCGAIFVTYTFCYYAAFGFAEDREQVLELGLINYLWTVLTVLFSVPILKYKARWYLWPGVLLAFSGIVLACTSRDEFSFEGISGRFSSGWYSYLFALGAGLTWGLYSNYNRKWGENESKSGVPLFFLASGAVMLVLRMTFPEKTTWTPRVAAEFIYMTLGTTVLAYIFWDVCMRKGNLVLAAVLSYFIPVISTLFTAVFLDVETGAGLWIGCMLVVAGAYISKKSILESKENRGTRVEGSGGSI